MDIINVSFAVCFAVLVLVYVKLAYDVFFRGDDPKGDPTPLEFRPRPKVTEEQVLEQERDLVVRDDQDESLEADWDQEFEDFVEADRDRRRDELKEVQNFDPIATYPAVEGRVMMSRAKFKFENNRISDLITSMTINNASPEELARAVRHSMVIVNSEKHNLNYVQSEIDNGIVALEDKYL